MAPYDILELILKVLTNDLLFCCFIVLNILYFIFKQIEWIYQSKTTKRKAALHSGKETNRRNKEPSLHHNQPHDVNTNVTLHSTGSLTECILERSTSPRNVAKMNAEDPTSTKAAARNVRRKVISTSEHFAGNFPISISIGDDNGDLKVDEIKIIVKRQLTNFQEIEQLLKPLFSTSLTTNSCKALECVDMKPMQGPDHQALMSYTNRPIINISKLRMYYLRKFLENVMMANPPIVQRSAQMYTEDCQIPPEQKSFSVSQERFIDSNRLELNPRLKSDIPVLNMAPPHLDFDYDSLMVNDKIKSPKKTHAIMGYSFDNLRKIPSPIGHRIYTKKLDPRRNFKRSKRHSEKDTDLPIGTLVRFGKKVVQDLSPEVCIDKSPKPNQIHSLEFGIMEGTEVGGSKFPTTNKINKIEVVEENGGNETVVVQLRATPHVTHHINTKLQQKPRILSYSKYEDVPTPRVKLVPYSCSDRDTTEVSDFRFSDVFATVKRLLVRTTEPSQPQRGEWRSKTRRKDP
ncbi:uncharacterized protein RB166_008056 [Leptodactylus fuscus]|uniref:uncharacterized protein LOC142204494 n=1 Tax=Leptodactylus fuscus TaxID=238119 RepID=UPI003F4EA464